MWDQCYHMGVECYHVGSNVLMLGRVGSMLSCGINVIMWGSNVIMWDQFYHVGVNVRLNVIIFCYHVMLSCDVIMGQDNTPPFSFS
jgi:hypothetical protein